MKNFILSDGTNRYHVDILQIQALFERLDEGEYKLLINGTESESFDIHVGGTSATLMMAGDSVISYDKTDGYLNIKHGDGSLDTLKTLNPHGSVYPILYETEPDSYLTGYSSYSIRSVIQNPSNLFYHAFSNSLRLRLQSLKSYPTMVTDVYIGYKAASGNAWDFESAPIHVTFGDQSLINIDYAGVISDLIEFQLDETKDFVIAYNMFDMASYIPYTSETDCSVYAKASVQEAHLQNPTGYSQILTNSIVFMGAIGGEVPNEYWNGDTLYTSRFTITGNVIVDETANGIIIPYSKSITHIDIPGQDTIDIDVDETLTITGTNIVVSSDNASKTISLEATIPETEFPAVQPAVPSSLYKGFEQSLHVVNAQPVYIEHKRAYESPIEVVCDDTLYEWKGSNSNTRTILLTYFDDGDQSEYLSNFVPDSDLRFYLPSLTTEGDTTLQDYSSYNQAMTLASPPIHREAQRVVGKTSLEFVGGYLQIDNINIKTYRCTMEAFIYPTDVTTHRTIFGNEWSNNTAISLYMQDGTFWVSHAFGGAVDTGISATINAWQHVTWVLKDTDIILFLNGKLVYNHGQGPVSGGSSYTPIGGNYWRYLGYMDEIKIWDDEKYTSDFDPYSIDRADPIVLDIETDSGIIQTVFSYKVGTQTWRQQEHVFDNPYIIFGNNINGADFKISNASVSAVKVFESPYVYTEFKEYPNILSVNRDIDFYTGRYCVRTYDLAAYPLQFAVEGNHPIHGETLHTVTYNIEYLDTSTDTFVLTGHNGSSTVTDTITKTASNTWKSVSGTLGDVRFNGDFNGYDFIIRDASSTECIISSIVLHIESKNVDFVYFAKPNVGMSEYDPRLILSTSKQTFIEHSRYCVENTRIPFFITQKETSPWNAEVEKSIDVNVLYYDKGVHDIRIEYDTDNGPEELSLVTLENTLTWKEYSRTMSGVTYQKGLFEGNIALKSSTTDPIIVSSFQITDLETQAIAKWKALQRYSPQSSVFHDTNNINLTKIQNIVADGLEIIPNTDQHSVVLKALPTSLPPLELQFDYTQINNNTLLIGTIPAQKRVYSVYLVIDSTFDNTTCTIGDDVGQGRFLTEQDSDLSLIESYQSFDTYLYTTETDISIYFTGSPTQGSGSVVIFYQ